MWVADVGEPSALQMAHTWFLLPCPGAVLWLSRHRIVSANATGRGLKGGTKKETWHPTGANPTARARFEGITTEIMSASSGRVHAATKTIFCKAL